MLVGDHFKGYGCLSLHLSLHDKAGDETTCTIVLVVCRDGGMTGQELVKSCVLMARLDILKRKYLLRVDVYSSICSSIISLVNSGETYNGATLSSEYRPQFSNNLATVFSTNSIILQDNDILCNKYFEAFFVLLVFNLSSHFSNLGECVVKENSDESLSAFGTTDDNFGT